LAEPTLISLFDRAARSMVTELVAELGRQGFPQIRAAHSRVFEHLEPGGVRLTVLAARAQMTHPAMSELVTDLEVMGFVRRRPDPSDGRARIVELTPAGRRLQRRALAVMSDIEARWFAGRDPGSQELVDSLRRALEQATARPVERP
jgi:DNA-binding MarR family transcriptional regulator